MKTSTCTAAAATLAALLALIALSAPSMSHAARFLHTSVNFCMTPLEMPAGETVLVLHRNGAKCTDAAQTQLDFHYDDQRKRLVHTSTDRCVRWTGLKRNPPQHVRMILDPNCKDERGHLLFERMFFYNIYDQCLGLRHRYETEAGLIHNNLEILLRNECHTAFQVRKAVSPSPPPPTRGLLVHRTSEQCLIPQNYGKNNNTTIVLHDECDYRSAVAEFQLLPNGALKHSVTRKCVHPHGGRDNPGNNTRLVLHQGCKRKNLAFKRLENGVLQHRSSGKCVHPSGGSPTPRVGSGLVLHDGCRGDRLVFDFVPL